jgi:2-polyprenyl-3-methyl-5-hydroxy-6-metoxy-1,4-benzoquinol methylase
MESSSMVLYPQETIESKSLLKRFSHGRRFRRAIELLNPGAGERIVDFGTGDGHFLRLLLNLDSGCELTGYDIEPDFLTGLNCSFGPEIATNRLRIIGNLSDLEPAYFNKLTCLEVLEHVPEANHAAVLSSMANLIGNEGSIIVSVPVEIGLTALGKNLVRVMVRQAHEGTSLQSILRSVFGLRVNRRINSAGAILSHIGFNYKILEKTFRECGLVIVRRTFSPIPILHGLANSQVFYVLRKA